MYILKILMFKYLKNYYETHEHFHQVILIFIFYSLVEILKIIKTKNLNFKF